MSLMRTILLFLIALVVASPVAAQTASSRGTGSASYGLRLSADTRAQALNKAKVNALEAYIAETGAAKLRLFEARRAEFIGEIDRYVLSAVQLSDTEDKKAKTYTVTVRAEINTTLLQTKLDAGSAVAGATAAQLAADLPVHGALAGHRAVVPGQGIPPRRRQQQLQREHP